MRVVGGKTGTDGRLFAHIVWTVRIFLGFKRFELIKEKHFFKVPGGPAEKGNLSF